MKMQLPKRLKNIIIVSHSVSYQFIIESIVTFSGMITYQILRIVFSKIINFHTWISMYVSLILFLYCFLLLYFFQNGINNRFFMNLIEYFDKDFSNRINIHLYMRITKKVVN